MYIDFSKQRRVISGIGASLLAAFILTAIVAGTLFAQPSAANLETSTKTVNRSQAFPGQTLKYVVTINNDGDTAVPNLTMTDTLPSGLAYLPGTLTYTLNSAAAASFGESNGVISWTGVVSDLGSVVIHYSAILTDSLVADDEIINAVEITGTGDLITRTALTTIITSTQMYFPIVFQPVPAPVLNSIPGPSSSNQWTVSWADINVSGAVYELQEYGNTSFAAPTTFNAGSSLSQLISHGASTNNRYCYRVRAKVNEVFSGWSNVHCTYGNYSDGFSSPSGWSIRRQDSDDTQNSTYYQDGKFVIKIGGRWDYAIAAPMVPAPAGSYKIETAVRLSDGIDNLHTYGIVFGGDWNGQPCPVNCFNHYYRLQVIWSGSSNQLGVDLKRIDYHDSNNIGRGFKKLIEFRDVNVPDPSGWNKWTIIVQTDGLISVYVNDKYVGGGVDTTYINDRYFGGFAAANEYSGTAAQFDWFNVSGLP